MPVPPVVTAYFAAWNCQDSEGIVRCFHRNGLYHDPYVPDGVGGHALARYTQSVFNDLPDLSFTVLKSYFCNEATIVEWMMGSESTIKVVGVDIFVVRQDKIDRVQGYFDRKTFEAQRKSIRS